MRSYEFNIIYLQKRRTNLLPVSVVGVDTKMISASPSSTRFQLSRKSCVGGGLRTHDNSQLLSLRDASSSCVNRYRISFGGHFRRGRKSQRGRRSTRSRDDTRGQNLYRHAGG